MAEDLVAPARPDTGRRDPFLSFKSERDLALFLIVTILLLAFGMWSMWPYYLQQDKRLEPWKGWLVWTFDALALFWFVRVIVWYFVLGRRLNADERTHPGRWIVGSVLAALAIDAGVSVAVLLGERAAYRDAVVTTGTVTQLQVGHERPINKYKLTYEFRDQQGELHSAFSIIAKSAGAFPEGISPETWENLNQQKPGFAIKIAYDPRWPDRCWLQERGFSIVDFFGDDLSGLSLVFLIPQLLLLPGFFIDAFSRAECRWWLKVHEGFPLAVEAVFLAIAGLYCSWLF